MTKKSKKLEARRYKRCNMRMKKIVSVCLCICLMSGCDKSLSHGSPVSSVTKDTGSEATPSLTSNASAAEPSKNAVGYATIAIICALVYRLVIPLKVVKNDFRTSKDNERINVPFGEVSGLGYKLCDMGLEEITSYTLYFFKKVTCRYFFRDSETKAELKGITILFNDNAEARNKDFPCRYLYRPNPAT
jgi:hypothetical protein